MDTFQYLLEGLKEYQFFVGLGITGAVFFVIVVFCFQKKLIKMPSMIKVEGNGWNKPMEDLKEDVEHLELYVEKETERLEKDIPGIKISLRKDISQIESKIERIEKVSADEKNRMWNVINSKIDEKVFDSVCNSLDSRIDMIHESVLSLKTEINQNTLILQGVANRIK